MPSAAEECREPSGNCQEISHCLESGYPTNRNWHAIYRMVPIATTLSDVAKFLIHKASGNLPTPNKSMYVISFAVCDRAGL